MIHCEEDFASYADAKSSRSLAARRRRTATVVPGLKRVDLRQARQAIPALHAYLRECVLDGTLTPGAKLSQVALAGQLGVSRTPLREVLRMLQEEGLVEIQPNQRTRVAGLDPRELDDVYACRILLETLALSMTLQEFSASHQRAAKRMLTAMRQAARSGDSAMWFQSHGEFHRIITAAAGNALQRQLIAFADRSTRYIRICRLAEPASWQKAGDTEHAAILAALAEGDDQAALSGLAQHLAGTAERVLTECAPAYEINAVPRALALVAGRRA
jgi:DNA-binding GntR family transcriptional regulator